MHLDSLFRALKKLSKHKAKTQRAVSRPGFGLIMHPVTTRILVVIQGSALGSNIFLPLCIGVVVGQVLYALIAVTSHAEDILL